MKSRSENKSFRIGIFFNRTNKASREQVAGIFAFAGNHPEWEPHLFTRPESTRSLTIMPKARSTKQTSSCYATIIPSAVPLHRSSSDIAFAGIDGSGKGNDESVNSINEENAFVRELKKSGQTPLVYRERVKRGNWHFPTRKSSSSG